MGFVDGKLNSFIKENGYIPNFFNPYNQKEIKDYSPTITTQCGTTTSSATVLIIKNTENNNGGNDMKEFTNNILKKLNFKLNGGIKLFDSFAGIGALHQALKELGVPVELVGTSEIDVNAIISYSAVHEISIDEVEPLGTEEMKQYLIDRNIGYDFTKGKSTVPRMRKDKLEILYKSCVATNNLGDISLINPDDIPDFDLFNMSFPCTDLSVSGKQKGMTNEDGTPTRSGLAKFGVEIIKHKNLSI